MWETFTLQSNTKTLFYKFGGHQDWLFLIVELIDEFFLQTSVRCSKQPLLKISAFKNFLKVCHKRTHPLTRSHLHVPGKVNTIVPREHSMGTRLLALVFPVLTILFWFVGIQVIWDTKWILNLTGVSLPNSLAACKHSSPSSIFRR